jgi:NADH-quinone oxidoreductase subunit J
MILATIFFYLFTVLLLGSAALVVSARNPVHSVLFLILAFFNAAGLFLLLGAEFLAMILLIVYVGAVAVLFMFVVMMLDVNFAELRGGFQRYAPVGAVVGAVLCAELLAVLGGWRFAPAAPTLRLAPQPANVQNTVALGRLLYTHYVLLFQIAGVALLVAMIGAIVLTHRGPQRSRRQDIGAQTARSVGETMEILRIPLGAGVNEIGIRRPPVAAPEVEPAGGGDLPSRGAHAPEGR